MSVGLLYDFVQESKVSDELIILLMLLMHDQEILKKKTWRYLSQSFFRKYRKRIFVICGFESNKYGLDRIKIEKDYRPLFLSCIGSLERNGIFAGCSFRMLARCIDQTFDTGYTLNTVLNKLKEQNPDFEELDNAIYSEKKRIKSSGKYRK